MRQRSDPSREPSPSSKSGRRACIAGISSYLPEKLLTNDELASIYPEWPAEKILAKTGIAQRHIALDGQTAADLGYEAAMKLFAGGVCAASDIDFIILCTQAPDYILPTSACLLQDRLNIPRTAGALDINLGCSGFVYGLSLAKGLVETTAASNVLLLTADTYSKYIHPQDKSVRTLFGDAAAATLVRVAREDDGGIIGPFVFGTDGSGARNLIVEAGGFRTPSSEKTRIPKLDESGNIRTPENLLMDGPEIMGFSLKEVPKAIDALLLRAGLSKDEVDLFVLHQANQFMLESLRKKLRLPTERLPIVMKNHGNTVSSSIPLALEYLAKEGKLRRGCCAVLVGFGVGYSWAATVVDF